MRSLARVCVFCGSSPGARPAFAEATVRLAEVLVARGTVVVYGGASVGLMGTLADAALARGGEVIGIIPRHLVDSEIAHDGLSELRVVDSMAERKQQMADLADAFITLPGGFGTLEETFEMVVRSQLHLQDKPVGLLDVDGYFAGLEAFVARATEERLLHEANTDLLLFDHDPGRLLDRMSSWQPATVAKWLDR